MTPEEARREVNRTPKTEYARVDFNRHCAGEKALETIANMRWEYGVQDANGEIAWAVEDHFVDGDSYADSVEYLATFEPGQAKLVRRMVSAPEVTE